LSARRYHEDVATVTALKARRTQEQRSSSMRTRLLDATVSSLLELGYAGTTTVEIARRAGVSRGAQLHHFPTKAELVITAVEYLAERRHREFTDAFAKLPPGVDRAAAAIDLLWPILSGPTFYAWLELMVAARTDAELRRSVAAATERLMQRVQQTFRELFPVPPGGELLDDPPKFVFALLNGMAIEKMLHPADPAIEQNLRALKALAGLVQTAGVRRE
jgi:AcrR family transcriptional regulator